MTAPTQLHALGALEQAAAVRKGEVGPVELVRHHLDRVERYDEQFGAFVTVTPDAALAGAAAARERRADGDLPPLFGVPTAVKDLVDTAGVRTTYGSKAFAGGAGGRRLQRDPAARGGHDQPR